MRRPNLKRRFLSVYVALQPLETYRADIAGYERTHFWKYSQRAFRELIYYLMKFGRSPLLSPPQRYGYVAVWREVLAPPPPGRAKASQSKRKFMETMERVDEIAASQQFKPLDEVARNLLLQRFGAKFDLRGLGILGIPIGTEPDAKGSSIGGCLFALVYGPTLTVKQLDDLAVYEILFLKSHPLKATHSVHAAEAPRDAKEELIQARKLAGLPSLRAPKRKKAAKA